MNGCTWSASSQIGCRVQVRIDLTLYQNMLTQARLDPCIDSMHPLHTICWESLDQATICFYFSFQSWCVCCCIPSTLSFNMLCILRCFSDQYNWTECHQNYYQSDQTITTILHWPLSSVRPFHPQNRQSNWTFFQYCTILHSYQLVSPYRHDCTQWADAT